MQGWRGMQASLLGRATTQCRIPSVDSALQAVSLQPSQPPSIKHERAHVPFGRQVCPLGQGQVMVWLQLLLRLPQPRAQVVACDSGTQPGGGGEGGGTTPPVGLRHCPF